MEMPDLHSRHHAATIGHVKILKWTVSGKLERFYKRQVQALGYEPEFSLNPNMRYHAQVVTPAGQRSRIEVRPDLSKKQAEHTIAHEIMHIVLYQEGYPVVKAHDAHPDWENCAGILNDMLTDPIIERRLEEEGLFDREEESKRRLRRMSRDFSHSVIQVPCGGRSWLGRIFKHVEIALELSNSVREEYVLRYAQAQQPDIVREGQYWLSVVHEQGFETSLQCREILHRVFERYDLIPYMVIHDPRIHAPYKETWAWLRGLKKRGKIDLILPPED